jgi:hypothetical protein
MHLPPSRSFVFAATVLVGCATTANYVYVPRGASYWREGYPIEATEVSQGKIEVTSFGISELVPEGTALHVRLTVTNDGDATPWTVTTADQVLELGSVRNRPVLVKTDVETIPVLAVAQHEHRVIDLYYHLPASVREEKDLATFDLVWQVATPGRLVSARTHFQRVEEEPTQPYSHVTFRSSVPYWFR